MIESRFSAPTAPCNSTPSASRFGAFRVSNPCAPLPLLSADFPGYAPVLSYHSFDGGRLKTQALATSKPRRYRTAFGSKTEVEFYLQKGYQCLSSQYEAVIDECLRLDVYSATANDGRANDDRAVDDSQFRTSTKRQQRRCHWYDQLISTVQLCSVTSAHASYKIQNSVRNINTFCGTWYLLHSQVHNDRTVSIKNRRFGHLIGVILYNFYCAYEIQPL